LYNCWRPSLKRKTSVKEGARSVTLQLLELALDLARLTAGGERADCELLRRLPLPSSPK
jgi:hypothetical protein